MPVVPEVIEIQLPLLVAIQLQLEAVTVKLPVPPVEGTLAEAGFKVTGHPGGGPEVPASWLMPITWLPAMTVAVRCESVFAATVKLAVPFPVPDKVPESVIHDADV